MFEKQTQHPNYPSLLFKHNKNIKIYKWCFQSIQNMAGNSLDDKLNDSSRPGNSHTSTLDRITNWSFNKASHVTNFISNMYEENAHWINAATIGTGATVGGLEIIAKTLNTGTFGAGVFSAAAAFGPDGMKKVGERIDSRMQRWSAYSAAALTHYGLGELVLGGIPEVAFETTGSLDEYAALTAGIYGARHAGETLLKKIYERDQSTVDEDRRDFIRIGGKITAGTIAAYHLGLPAARMVKNEAQETIDELNSRAPTKPGHLQDETDLKIWTSFPGNRSVRDGTVRADDVLEVSLKVEDAQEIAGQEIRVDYFMVNNEYEKAVQNDKHEVLGDQIIDIGHTTMKVYTDGTGTHYGTFQYTPDTEETFIPNSNFINPHDAREYESDEFSFLVQLETQDGTSIKRKWWGREQPYTMRFRTPDGADKTPEIPAPTATATDRNVFVYKQAVSRDRWDEALGPITDVFHPHLYQFTHRDEVFIDQRVNSKTLQKVRERGEHHGYDILPMIGAMNKPLINRVLRKPRDAAQQVRDIVEAHGWDGILVDFESTNLYAEDSPKLNRFMKELRGNMPEGQYKLGVAVSPRFAGSAENGYEHHGFYDYEGLQPNTDFLEIMFYDFHKPADKGASAVSPLDKMDEVVDYARQRVEDEKTTILNPLYGYVWTKQGYPIGTLATSANDRFTPHAVQSTIEQGERHIITSDREIYTQDETTFRLRHTKLQEYDIDNVGYWRQSHASEEIVREIRRGE